MANRAPRMTHFYPLALSSYDLLPPPDTVDEELGEWRNVQAASIHMAFGPEIDMNHFPGSEQKDKQKRRQLRAEHIWKQVCSLFEELFL